MLTAIEKVAAVQAALPREPLFAEKEWLISPEPFSVDPSLHEQLVKLGHRLNLFLRACNELYARSAAGKQFAWVAPYLDRGKPRELVEVGRTRRFRNELPQVLRPDLVLTDDGFTIAELDNIPGGIGLTGWLNQTYAAIGNDVIGGPRGMIDGFNAIAPQADILVSAEAATYRPEMEWLARELITMQPQAPGANTTRVVDAADYSLNSRDEKQVPVIYRFFELFDLENIPHIKGLIEAAVRGEVRVTPPFKPALEEKMWFALFWLRPLREFWRQKIGERHFLELQKHIPYTWILDPTPIPHHAVVPGLEVNTWHEITGFSQKQRDLILKISGFHSTAWGSRSVVLGSDVPQSAWQASVEHALAQFEEHPHILQRFHKGRLVEHPFFNSGTRNIETMRGRVRLCPYYFVVEGRAELCGALATICPADKKLLHGTKDAILAPTSVRTTTRVPAEPALLA